MPGAPASAFNDRVAALREADVSLVAASDARYATEVGHWQYLRRV